MSGDYTLSSDYYSFEPAGKFALFDWVRPRHDCAACDNDNCKECWDPDQPQRANVGIDLSTAPLDKTTFTWSFAEKLYGYKDVKPEKYPYLGYESP